MAETSKQSSIVGYWEGREIEHGGRLLTVHKVQRWNEGKTRALLVDSAGIGQACVWADHHLTLRVPAHLTLGSIQDRAAE